MARSSQNRFFRRDTAYSFVTEQASWRQIEPAYILEGLWTSQVSNNLLLDFRVGWNKITFPLGYQSDYNNQPDLINQSVILQPAGIQRLPSVNMLNLRLSREFVIGDRWHLIPTADFFNVTNAQTVIGEVTTYGSGYLFPYATINPYATRFGLRVTF